MTTATLTQPKPKRRRRRRADLQWPPPMRRKITIRAPANQTIVQITPFPARHYAARAFCCLAAEIIRTNMHKEIAIYEAKE